MLNKRANGYFFSFLLKNLLVIFLLAGLLCSGVLQAQTGGRKKEPKARKRGNVVLTQYKSRGHADEFAKGSSGRRGWISRLFRKDRPAWQYKSSGSARSHYKENRFLFFRQRSEGKIQNSNTTDRQNRIRAKERRRGSDTFGSRKFKRKKS